MYAMCFCLSSTSCQWHMSLIGFYWLLIKSKDAGMASLTQGMLRVAPLLPTLPSSA